MKSKIALTFDDGPSRWTLNVLDVLKYHHAKASFFLIGRAVDEFPEIVQAIKKRGHLIGSHTYSHLDMRGFEPEAVRKEIVDGDCAIIRATGDAPLYFRPPFSHDVGQVGDLIVSRPSIAPPDWLYNANAIVEAVLSEIAPGAIIGLHDGPDRLTIRKSCESTVWATERILASLSREYKFVRVDEL